MLHSFYGKGGHIAFYVATILQMKNTALVPSVPLLSTTL